MPIKGLSEQRRLPRLGKIHLGYKDEKKRGAPTATDYFVCPPEVQKIYGEKPQRLDVIIPVEDEEMWANQYYRRYSQTRGLVCKGDGETCRRMVDQKTGDIANRNSKGIVWTEGLCKGRDCPDYQAKACQEVMNLQFLLPRVAGLGIWQIDTGSINSIRNINSCATMIRAVCERVSWIPLVLTLEPTEVVNPDDGKKKMVRCLNLRSEKGLPELLIESGKARADLLITAPAENEAPLDIIEVKAVVDTKQAEKDTEELFPSDPEHAREVAVKPTQTESRVDMAWLIESVNTLKWDILQYIKETYKVETSGNLGDVVNRLSSEQQNKLCREVQERLSML